MKIKLLILVLIYSLMLSFAFSIEQKNHISSWKELFPDPVERIYIIMKDGFRFKQTNYEERLIYIGAGTLEKILKKNSYKIKDIEIIIHNHRFEREFSDADWRFYRDLKRREFNGYFLIYCHWTNKIYPIEKKQESK